MLQGFKIVQKPIQSSWELKISCKILNLFCFCHLGSKIHIWRLLDPSLCSFSTLQCFPHPALSGHLQVSLVPFRTPAACRTLCRNLIHFVSGVQCSRDMIGGIWHTSRAALPLLACMLQGFKIVWKPIQSSWGLKIASKILNLFYFCYSGSKIHIWRLLNPSLCSFSTLQCFPHPALSGHLQVSLVPFRTPAACSNTPLKLNSFCFRCQVFKRHDWRHLAHFSCSSATAGMHAARIQNCPEAHPEQLRIKDCFQNT